MGRTFLIKNALSTVTSLGKYVANELKNCCSKSSIESSTSERLLNFFDTEVKSFI